MKRFNLELKQNVTGDKVDGFMVEADDGQFFFVDDVREAVDILDTQNEELQKSRDLWKKKYLKLKELINSKYGSTGKVSFKDSFDDAATDWYKS